MLTRHYFSRSKTRTKEVLAVFLLQNAKWYLLHCQQVRRVVRRHVLEHLPRRGRCVVEGLPVRLPTDFGGGRLHERPGGSVGVYTEVRAGRDESLSAAQLTNGKPVRFEDLHAREVVALCTVHTEVAGTSHPRLYHCQEGKEEKRKLHDEGKLRCYHHLGDFIETLQY